MGTTTPAPSLTMRGRTVCGISVWRVPGRKDQHLTWDGPGAPIVVRRHGTQSDRDGDVIGTTDAGTVSEPCADQVAAQAAVDAWWCSQAQTVYRWRGVDPRGSQRGGRMTVSSLPALVACRYDQGWRSLVITAGDGPTPPPAVGAEDVVAEITRHPDTGRRVWWAGDRPSAGAHVTPTGRLL